MMSKSKHFIGQPLYRQLLNLIDKSQVLQDSRVHMGERYIKRFDAWTHLVVMLYAVIRRFDSLREISTSLQAEAHKLKHLGILAPAARSTLSDANKRRSQAVFADIYRDLYARYAQELSSDSRSHKPPQRMKRLQIIDSTTITLFSNLIFKGVGRHPKNGKKKGGIKVHTVIHANEGVPSDVRFTSAATVSRKSLFHTVCSSDVRFTSAATHDSFMLSPAHLPSGAIVALDRAYVDYEKFERMTQQGVIYVTKMKKGLNYDLLTDTMLKTPEGTMEVRLQEVLFVKKRTAEEPISHRARIITYVDVAKHKLVSLLSNDCETDPRELIEIYRKRWLIELLFKQIKQNFPLKYFYGESANAIQIQIWVTLIANLLLMVMQRRLKRSWSFSGLASMVRIVLMYYVEFYSLFNHPERDWEALFAQKEVLFRFTLYPL